MDIMPFYMVFLQSLPETAILISLGLVLIGVQPRLLPVLLTALITAISCYYIRALPLPPGVNILLQLPIMIAMLVLLLKIRLSSAVIASFLGIICVSLTEILFNGLISAITGIAVLEAVDIPLWRILFPLPEFAFLIIVILMFKHHGITLFNLSEIDELEHISNDEKR